MFFRAEHGGEEEEDSNDDEDGRVYLWRGYNHTSSSGGGGSGNGGAPRRLRFPCAVIHVSMGEAHCAFVTESGALFVLGDNSHGQLGIGEAAGKQEKPVQVQALAGQNIMYL